MRNQNSMYKTKITTKLTETIDKLNGTEFKWHFYSIKVARGLMELGRVLIEEADVKKM